MKRLIYILVLFLTLLTGCSVDGVYNKDSSPSSASTILNETLSLFDYNVSSLDFALKIDSLISSPTKNRDSIALKYFGVDITLRKNGNIWYIVDGYRVIVVTTDGRSIREHGAKWSVNIGSEISLSMKSAIECTANNRWKVTHKNVSGDNEDGAIIFIKLKEIANHRMKNMYVYQVDGSSSYTNTTFLMRTYKVNYKIVKPFIFEDIDITSGEIEQSVSILSEPSVVDDISAIMIRENRFLMKYKDDKHVFQRNRNFF